ncbi:dioxygenase [Methylomonas sp. LL1]|uniref:DODA-type extradiol aromatic ring-opening family dioxygenase n=1 Tax=Methylomonas sp. LL1 TaxID=2785785 RepID=UPI0018C396B4|nr:class III extradiol ring-cleavage dioxygenase [Methylomonas sp. LL1]QPK65343.1 dioxygenase [Methylomonas sp. LL1]
MTSALDDRLSPVLFIPHGGGPLPLLGDTGHRNLIRFLQGITSDLGKPSAICVISAHWEEPVATITSGESPWLIYDYYGFPDQAYAIQYPVQGLPKLATRIFDLLKCNGIEARLDDRRGFDHGLFVPLKIMFRNAQIPCVQLSLVHGLDPETHIKIGKAISALRKDNILFLGSGFSFHNLNAFVTPNNHASDAKNQSFENWLIDSCTNPKLSPHERETRLIRWKEAPNAGYCHPREEHLLPLHVCFGLSNAAPARLVFDGEVLEKKTSAFLW